MGPPATGYRGSVDREHVLTVLRLFVEVKELSNYWIELRKWGVILEQTYFPPTVARSGVMRLSKKLGIPPHLFWHPESLQEYLNGSPTEPIPSLGFGESVQPEPAAPPTEGTPHLGGDGPLLQDSEENH